MSIRTTVTLDDDIVDRIKQRSRERGDSFKQTLNNLLRFALSTGTPEATRKPFKVRPFDSEPMPGLNFDKISELLDYAEGEDRKW
jgi:hypothetical protein